LLNSLERKERRRERRDGLGEAGIPVSGAGCGDVDVSDTIFAASRTTSLTRFVQPLPKVGHVFRRLRKAMRRSHKSLMTVARMVLRTAASVAGPILPSTLAPTTICRYFAARAGPECTAKSKTA